MKILYLVPYAPNLIRVRPYNIIRHLANQGHQVTVLTLWSKAREREDARRLEQFCTQVYSASLPLSRSLFNSLSALPSRMPLQANYCWQPLLRDRLVELALGSNGKAPFDIVHVEHLRGVKYALALKSHFNEQNEIPIVWDSVDSISMLFKQASAASKSFFGRWLTRFELGRTAGRSGGDPGGVGWFRVAPLRGKTVFDHRGRGDRSCAERAGSGLGIRLQPFSAC